MNKKKIIATANQKLKNEERKIKNINENNIKSINDDSSLSSFIHVDYLT